MNSNTMVNAIVDGSNQYVQYITDKHDADYTPEKPTRHVSIDSLQKSTIDGVCRLSPVSVTNAFGDESLIQVIDALPYHDYDEEMGNFLLVTDGNTKVVVDFVEYSVGFRIFLALLSCATGYVTAILLKRIIIIGMIGLIFVPYVDYGFDIYLLTFFTLMWYPVSRITIIFFQMAYHGRGTFLWYLRHQTGNSIVWFLLIQMIYTFVLVLSVVGPITGLV